MLSWIFRNRLRLRVIYGVEQAPQLPGPRFARGRRAPPASAPGRARPGEVRVLSRHVVMRPMPPRVTS